MSSRPAAHDDIQAIRQVLDDTDLFPVDMLDELIAPFLEDPSNPVRWFVHEHANGEIIGFGFYRPEPLTEGTWNLIAIGVREHAQGCGAGAAMMHYVEAALRSERVLLVETSGLPQYARTRNFYLRCGYTHEATIRDYWAEGDDKIVFWKALGA